MLQLEAVALNRVGIQGGDVTTRVPQSHQFCAPKSSRCPQPLRIPGNPSQNTCTERVQTEQPRRTRNVVG